MNRGLLTLQEHILFGSSYQDEKYLDNPYVPLLVLDGKVSVEECDKKRRLGDKLSNVPGGYWGEKYFQCDMSVEVLNLDNNSDKYGQTVRDPALVKLSHYFEKMKDFSSEFPYMRESKPRVELQNE